MTQPTISPASGAAGFNSNKIKLGIVGNGVVGSAMARAFEDWSPLIHDVMPERSNCSLIELLSTDLVLVCLPTPLDQTEGKLDTSILNEFFSVANDLFVARPGVHQPSFVIKSTVPIGFTRRVHEWAGLDVCHSPEFLSERTVMEDALNPKALLIGATGPIERIHDSMNLSCLAAFKWFKLHMERFPPCFSQVVSSDESEAIKLIRNGFHAVKVAFFNEVKSLVDALGLSWDSVLQGVLVQGWIDPHHTQVPGPDGLPGFGGRCLPKDLAQLIHEMRNNRSGRVWPYITCAAQLRNSILDRGRE